MNHTDESVSMLNKIYRDASMGVQGSELLINKTEDSEFAGKLHKYCERYNDIKNEAAELLSAQDVVPEDAKTMEKAGLWMGVQMNTLIDKTSSHMAEMLIEGSTMGIIESVKNKNMHPEADKKCVSLENKLMAIQHDQIDDMKQYLH